MSRQSVPSQRPLTLTEELEKLEQSITLTLQEIDHNFSQAHRIVTTSILPLVEQYAEHSRDVWEGSKFWKQFFEASANVSLSGYEERPNEEDTTSQEQTVTTEDEDTTTTNVTHSTVDDAASYETPSSEHLQPYHHRDEDLDLTGLTISSHSTPRPQTHESARHGDADTTSGTISYSSPYESLRKEVFETERQSSGLPTTPGKPSTENLTGRAHDLSQTPMSSPFIPPVSQNIPSTNKKNRYQKPTDPVLHRVLDKTYRVQATPLGKGYSGGAGPNRSKFTVTPKAAASSSRYAFDDSPISSPEPEAPQLHSELFSPVKTRTPRQDRKRRTSSHSRITPRPGISVLTPAKHDNHTGRRAAPTWDSDDDLDNDYDDVGPSPPKTMQFHIPQSRLMKTPAKEASKRIVSDLLATAGAEDITDDMDEEQSPSVIRRVERLEDETF